MNAKVPLFLLVLALGLLLSTTLGGCGHHHHDSGVVVVENRTDLTSNEDLLTFRLAAFGLPFSADLLGGPLPPAGARVIGSFEEDYYDAEGELELGQVVEWFDIWVGDADTTYFEAR